MGDGPDANVSGLAVRWRLGAGRDVHRGWPVHSLVPGRRIGENKTGTTLVEVVRYAASDAGSTPAASTIGCTIRTVGKAAEEGALREEKEFITGEPRRVYTPDPRSPNALRLSSESMRST